MIQIDGTDYLEPSDLTIVSWNGDLYFRVDNISTDAGLLLKCSDLDSRFAPVVHNDHGDELVYAGSDCKIEFGELISRVGKVGVSCIDFYTYPTSKQVHVKGDDYIFLHTKLPGASYGRIVFDNAKYMETQPAGSGQYFLADGFIVYGCRASDKTNKKKISDPKEKLKRLNGITFTQNGRKQTGITKEDLETTGLPGVVHHDEETGEFKGVSLVGLIPLLVEEVKALRSELDALKEK